MSLVVVWALKRWVISCGQGAEPKILETYSKLTMKDAMDYMQRNPSTIGSMSGTESMSALFRNFTAANAAGLQSAGRCAYTSISNGQHSNAGATLMPPMMMVMNQWYNETASSLVRFGSVVCVVRSALRSFFDL